MERMDIKEALQKAEPFLLVIALVAVVFTALFGLRPSTRYQGEAMTNHLIAEQISGDDPGEEDSGNFLINEEASGDGISGSGVSTEKTDISGQTEEMPEDPASFVSSNEGSLSTSSAGEILSAASDEATYYFGEADEDVVSEYAIMIDVEDRRILGEKNGKEKIYPASMTKILTLLVGAEHMSSMEDPFTITIDITDYAFINDCSIVGFEVGETVTVKDLLYGTILPSGADAAVGLAVYCAGSQEAFVEMMNDKLAELGLSRTTHFTNCVGIHNEDHYSTPYDMAVILKAAMDNPICREVLSAHTYTTSATEYHPEGITVSNWFLRRIEDKDCGGLVVAAKTGFVVESRNCAASLAQDKKGREYICVTAGSTSSWRCIYDHVAIYSRFFNE